jgi:hypothetical protein
MALKKGDNEKEPTAEELEAQRVADAKAEEDRLAQEKLDQKNREDEAARVEEERLARIEADKKLEEEKAQTERDEKEQARLALEKEESDKRAESERQRLAQEAEVARAAGKRPLEKTLVLVESLTFSDLRQPSTGTWIKGKGEEHLLNDGWLQNQVNSKLLKIISE